MAALEGNPPPHFEWSVIPILHSRLKAMHGILATAAFELKGTQGLEYIFLRLLAQAIFQVFLGYFGY